MNMFASLRDNLLYFEFYNIHILIENNILSKSLSYSDHPVISVHSLLLKPPLLLQYVLFFRSLLGSSVSGMTFLCFVLFLCRGQTRSSWPSSTTLMKSWTKWPLNWTVWTAGRTLRGVPSWSTSSDPVRSVLRKHTRCFLLLLNEALVYTHTHTGVVN